MKSPWQSTHVLPEPLARGASLRATGVLEAEDFGASVALPDELDVVELPVFAGASLAFARGRRWRGLVAADSQPATT
ncbi:MAG: hypothetical protein HUU28_04390, partial [Planctomycetaceae bacterium]|nr:hypothetical protein [Planctomycetaceae bacterium]